MQRLREHFEAILSRNVTSDDLDIITEQCRKLSQDYALHIITTERPINEDSFTMFLINEIN